MTGVTSSNYQAAPRHIGRTIIAVSSALAAATMFASLAQAQSCQDLWVERNGYYKDAGYCFKTARAISFFGNAGCMYDDQAAVPLPRHIRSRIEEIKWLERSRGCD
ncbi:YARHG domain-containing protein [Rhodopseudomonas faecalis]|uniref:YARHG domain-containing protein n=1 Tax=Rhodopseudomonas faecalis TaxID=99655 RepID=A0A318TDD6_9BRAD|nr:YARHG domain-containing protein [Rhodopseudomonas faecalis]PYF01268.1 YARHG domain-containing protein [Rhodopseudomonas faecalis]